MPRKTREERAALARSVFSSQFNSNERSFLEFVLAHYVDIGVEELDQTKRTPLLGLKYHHPIADAITDLGRPEDINKAIAGLQR